MVHLAPSIHSPNTFYIFRDTGVEVRVTIRNSLILPSHNLTQDEANFIRENLIQKNVTIKSSIGHKKDTEKIVESERFAL